MVGNRDGDSDESRVGLLHGDETPLARVGLFGFIRYFFLEVPHTSQTPHEFTGIQCIHQSPIYVIFGNGVYFLSAYFPWHSFAHTRKEDPGAIWARLELAHGKFLDVFNCHLQASHTGVNSDVLKSDSHLQNGYVPDYCWDELIYTDFLDGASQAILSTVIDHTGSIW